MMITPDGTFNTNFPANKDSYNYAILNCAAVGTFGYLLSTFTSVFLVMAVQEVSGNIQNVPILLEWLGPLRLFPVWLALVSILALAFALFITLFVVYDPNYTTPLGPKVYHAILGLLLVFGPGLVLMLKTDHMLKQRPVLRAHLLLRLVTLHKQLLDPHPRPQRTVAETPQR